MTLPELSTKFSMLPGHAQLMLGVMLLSGVACFAVVVPGMLRQGMIQRADATAGVPPLPHRPPAFPQACDQLYTAFFLMLMLGLAVAGLLSGEADSSQSFGWGAFLLTLIIQVGLYLPMLIRYALQHPWSRPTRPWWHYLLLPLAVLAGMYACIVLVELMGISAWLVRTTGCPEYQDVVLTFSQGDLPQKLCIIIGAVLIAPVAEECCFRGFLFPTLRRWSGCFTAALTSSLLFGAIHASLAQMLPLTLFGLIQCAVYEKVRSLWLPIAVHMLFNIACLIATAVMLP